MTGRTVNIADFRCRAIKARSAHPSLRGAIGACALNVIEPSTGQRFLEAKDNATSSENPTVFDIGLAREAQRLRRRAVCRPIGMKRRATVIRFGDAQARALAGSRTPQPWSPAPEGPSDLPPAA